MKYGISGASALSRDFDARLPTLNAAVNGKQVFAHPTWTKRRHKKNALTKKLTLCFTLAKSFFLFSYRAFAAAIGEALR